jgi:hypothetical protein
MIYFQNQTVPFVGARKIVLLCYLVHRCISYLFFIAYMIHYLLQDKCTTFEIQNTSFNM